MNYEVRLINSIVDSGNYIEAISDGVENVFLEYKDIWNFIVAHYDQHSKVPSKDTIKHHFPDFDFVSTPEPLKYYVDEAKRESLAYQTRLIVSKSNNILTELGAKDALSFLMEQTSKLYKFSSSLKDTDLVGEWEDRVKDLKERSERSEGDFMGIPSGITVIDKTFGG